MTITELVILEVSDCLQSNLSPSFEANYHSLTNVKLGLLSKSCTHEHSQNLSVYMYSKVHTGFNQLW